MRLIDADKMAAEELAAFISAQAKITDAANRDINSIVHAKIQRLIANTPTVEDAVQVVRCRECKYHEEEGIEEEEGIKMVYCPNMSGWVENEWFCANGKRKEGAE